MAVVNRSLQHERLRKGSHAQPTPCSNDVAFFHHFQHCLFCFVHQFHHLLLLQSTRPQTVPPSRPHPLTTISASCQSHLSLTSTRLGRREVIKHFLLAASQFSLPNRPVGSGQQRPRTLTMSKRPADVEAEAPESKRARLLDSDYDDSKQSFNSSTAETNRHKQRWRPCCQTSCRLSRIL